MKRTRGMGALYKRNRIWWIKYSFRGRCYRESSRSEVRADAVKLLRRRQAEMGTGHLAGPDAEKVTFDDLAKLLVDDYVLNGRKSLARAEQQIKRLREYFGTSRAVDITPDRVTSYIRHRLEGAEKRPQPATVRNEIGALGRMFTLAYRAGKVPSRPPFPSLQVRNTRTGFFEDGELLALLGYLPEYMRAFTECAFLTGWRRGELRSLTWRQVDFENGIVRLEPGSTKNEEGRSFPFRAYPRLDALLRAQRERTTQLERATGQVIRWVFHREGKQVADSRDSWTTACRKAGIPGRLMHDLRRTAVRNLERACVPRSVAMKLTGHKTENVYRRYAIVSESDLAEAVQKLAALDTQRGKAIGIGNETQSDGQEGFGTLRAQSGVGTGPGGHLNFPHLWPGQSPPPG